MTYIPHEWMNKELITAEKLNHIENGVKEAGEASGGEAAQGYAKDAQASKTAAAGSATDAAESAAESAQSAAASAKALEDNRAYVESQKETFVGYNKRETDTKYANALIGSASGTGRVSVGDAWEAPVTDLEVSGRSEQMVTTGAQLLDISKIAPKTSDGITFTPKNDGTIESSGSATDYAYIRLLDDYLDAGDYYISGCPVGGSSSTYCIKVMITDGNITRAVVDDGGGAPIAVPEGARVYLDITLNSGVSGQLAFRPMLNKGTAPIPWEPYTGGKPSPSPEYPQEIVGTDVTSIMVTGAQLMDTSRLARTHNDVTFSVREDGGILVTGNTLEKLAHTAVVSTNLSPGTYYVSGSVPAADPKIFVKAKKWYSDGKSNVINDASFIVDGTESNIEYFIYIYQGVSDINEIVYPMLNAGPTALPYQPYQSRTAAITLTAPLRGIGDYRDRIMRRGGEWGIERWIKETILNGSVSEVWRLYNTEESAEGLSFFITFSGSAQNFHSSMCDKYSNVACAWRAEHKNKTGIYSDHNDNVLKYFRPPNTDVRTIEQWREWLSANPLTMVCQMTTPTWEPLPAVAQSALNALTTYTGTTHVTVTAGGPEPDVGLEYVQDTRAVIADLQALLDELAHRSGGQYKPGDEFIISADTAGFVTSSRREVRVSVYTDKPLSEDITSASLVSGKANVIQAGNYLIGAAGDATDLLDYTCKVTIRSRSCLSISITSESIYTNSVNNDVAGVILREVQIKFE